ncbi:MAG: DJ-1/PfpI family protein [Flavobacteriaceae bacterium]|nr:DJ-1/PfpI family protein [Flavobacteriaceae bacterium]
MKIAILIYEGLTMLDAIGPYEVLSNLRDSEVYLVAKKKGVITADTGFASLKIKYDFNDISKADILVIPGASISFIKVMKDKTTLDWIKKVAKTTQFTTSVCSGSIILAATGLLDGLKSTSHWKSINLLEEFNAIPIRERIVQEGKYITSAGVSAGIDMALYLCNELAREKETKAIQLLLEYDPKPLYNAGNFTTSEPQIVKIAEKKLQSNAKKSMNLFQLLKNRKILMKIK